MMSKVGFHKSHLKPESTKTHKRGTETSNKREIIVFQLIINSIVYKVAKSKIVYYNKSKQKMLRHVDV